MTIQLYGRKASLVVGSNSGNAIDLSNMRFHFRTQKATVGTPNALECRVWNLSDATVRLLTASYAGPRADGATGPEFTRVVLSAGYVNGFYGTIFDGEIRYFRKGRESPTDTYLDIYATDSDRAHNYAVVNAAVPPGSNNAQLISVINNAMVAKGASAGVNLPFDDDFTMPRGRVCFGKASNISRSVAEDIACQWSIQNGVTQYLPRTQASPGAAIKVNSATGMIGIPVQTAYGIEVTMLLNPLIRFGAALQINNADIQTANLDLSIQGAAQNAFNKLGAEFLQADGLYKVIAGEYEGDTRGPPWYLKVVCVNIDGSTSNAAVQSKWLPGP